MFLSFFSTRRFFVEKSKSRNYEISTARIDISIRTILMEVSMLKRLPIGQQDFAGLVEFNAIYADKTEINYITEKL